MNEQRLQRAGKAGLSGNGYGCYGMPALGRVLHSCHKTAHLFLAIRRRRFQATFYHRRCGRAHCEPLPAAPGRRSCSGAARNQAAMNEPRLQRAGGSRLSGNGSGCYGMPALDRMLHSPPQISPPIPGDTTPTVPGYVPPASSTAAREGDHFSTHAQDFGLHHVALPRSDCRRQETPVHRG